MSHQNLPILLSKEKALNLTPKGVIKNHQNRLLRYFDTKNINAFISFDESVFFNKKTLCFSKKDRPLFGLPFSCKDNIFSKAFPTTAGTYSLRNFYSNQDAPIIEKLKNLGAILCGKNNMHELSFGVTSTNVYWGNVKNPIHPDHIVGGSSGGSAAAVAAGVASFSVGTDTGGSVRIPAALCGLTGFRPSTQRYPTEGIIPVSSTKDTPGFIAPTVKDISFLDAAIMSQEEVESLLPLRIGLPSESMWKDLDQNILNTCMTVVEALEVAGVEIIKFDDSELIKLNEQIQFSLPFFEFFIDFPKFCLRNGIKLDFHSIINQISDVDIKNIITKQMNENNVTCKSYIEYLNIINKLNEIWNGIFEKYNLDTIIYPTICCDIPLVKDSKDPLIFKKLVRNTDLASNLGTPSLTVPVAKKGKLSVGLSIDGLRNTDRQIMSYGLAITELL